MKLIQGYCDVFVWCVHKKKELMADAFQVPIEYGLVWYNEKTSAILYLHFLTLESSCMPQIA